MTKKKQEYNIPTGYGFSSPLDLRRVLSDLVAQAIDNKTNDGSTNKCESVYQHAAQLTNGCCFYCNQKLSKYDDRPRLTSKDDKRNRPDLIQGTYAWDHFVPVSKYGLLIKGNVVLACSKCNIEKSDSSAYDYWKSRKEQKLPLRFRTEEEFLKVQEELFTLEADYNIDNFYPVISSDEEFLKSEPKDILKAMKLVVESDIVKEYLETYTPGGVARWLRLSRDDADIFEQLADLDDSFGIYEKYAEVHGRELGFNAKNDVKARITRFCEYVHEITGVTDIRDLSDLEFMTLVRSLLKSIEYSGDEVTKFRRFIRVLILHPDLENFYNIIQEHKVL